jgi:quinolinate synthase
MSVDSSDSQELRLDEVWEKICHFVTPPEWEIFRPIISEIRRLKREKNVVILAHNYQPVEIFWGVADHTGDSLRLAQIAAEHHLPNVLMAGVYFMAETVKIISPATRVFIPSRDAGCSLAESVTAENVRSMRKKFHNAEVVTYVNTSAEVKAESDICCTSSNAVDVVNSCTSEDVIFIPDRHLAAFVQGHTTKRIHTWAGQCDVHDVFDVQTLNELRWMHPDIHVLVHPECRPDVQKEADFVGSTSALSNYIRHRKPERVALITECTMSANVAAECPETQFIQPCSLCPHMRRISLQKILRSLQAEQFEVSIAADVATRAKSAIDAMLSVSHA